MANNIVYDYQKIEAAAKKIEEISNSYKTAGETFKSNFDAAISAWEGESKDKLQGLINGDVNELLTAQVPSFVNALAVLLRENVTQMQNADTQIAQNIPAKLG